MKQFFTYNFFSTLFLLLFILALIPLLILCFYTQPSGDDYAYAVKLHGDTFFNIQIHEYLHWGSRYTATAILITNPIYFGWYFGYNLISFFMIILFIVASFFMFFCITENKRFSLLLTAFFCFSYLFMLPDIVSAFYWLPGSATYHLANILSLIFIGCIIKAFKTNSIFYKISLFILAFLIIGCNEISMVYIDCFIFILLLYSVFMLKKLNYLYFSLFVWAGILTLFILLAPGNSVRAESITNHRIPIILNILNALRKSTVVLIRYGFLIFIINFLVFYNIRNQLIKLDLKFLSLPLYFYCLLFIVLLFLGSFPSLWSLGVFPPLRTVNVILLIILIFSMIINYKLIICPIFSTIKFSQFSLSIILLFFILSYIFIIKDRDILNIQNNLYFAYNDLISEKAMKYKKEMEGTYAQIQNSKEDTIYIGPLQSKPKTIFYSELTENPAYFYNQSMAEFFNKKVIIRKNEK